MNKTIKNLVRKLIDGSNLYKQMAENEDGEIVNPDYVLVSLEFAAASRIARRALEAKELSMTGHLLDMLIALSAQYERLGYAFQAMEVDALIKHLSGCDTSAIADGDFASVA